MGTNVSTIGKIGLSSWLINKIMKNTAIPFFGKMTLSVFHNKTQL